MTMQRPLWLPLCILLILAVIGCDSGGDNGDDENGDFLVTATLTGSVPDSTLEFGSNDVLANYAGDFGFSLTAVDGDYTILIAVQSLEGEALSLGSYDIGEDGTTRLFASGSVVEEANGTNLVHNAIEGSGSINLQTFNAERAGGTFEFTATTITNNSTIMASGGFNIEF